jgi:hypothetical protein
LVELAAGLLNKDPAFNLQAGNSDWRREEE